MATQIGQFAVVWGIPSTNYEVNGTAVAFRTNAQNYGRAADKDITQDEVGETVQLTTFNQRETLTLTCYPTGADVAAAIVTGNGLPYPGDVVGVISPVGATDSDAKTHAPDPGRLYRCDSADQVRSNTAKAAFTINLERFAGITDYEEKANPSV